MNLLRGPSLERKHKMRNRREGGKSSSTKRTRKRVLLGLDGSDLFYCCFNLKVLLVGFLVSMLLLGCLVFLKSIIFETVDEKCSKERGERMLYGAEVASERSFSKGCSGARSQCPTKPPCTWPAERSERVNRRGTRWPHNHPKCLESSFKGPQTFPKQTLPSSWFCYESR